MARQAWRSTGGQRAGGGQRRRRERTTGIGLRDDNASRGRRHKGQRRHPRSSPGITARQPTARLDPCTPRRTHADHAGMNADGSRREGLSAHHGRRSTTRAKRAPAKLADLNQHRRSSRARTPPTLTPATRTCAGLVDRVELLQKAQRFTEAGDARGGAPSSATSRGGRARERRARDAMSSDSHERHLAGEQQLVNGPHESVEAIG